MLNLFQKTYNIHSYNPPKIPQLKLGNIRDCYIARLSLNKLSTVIG